MSPSAEQSSDPSPQLDARYLDRELSWLGFNHRVLEEALDPSNPLLERLRFLSIFQTNLDEFFMIRVSGLKAQVQGHVGMLSLDGTSPGGQLARITEIVQPDLEAAQACLESQIRPALAELGVRIVHYDELDPARRTYWDRDFHQRVYPILTPLAVGPTQTFPFISNLSLNLALWVTSPQGERRFARVKVPPTLARLLVLREDGNLRATPPVELLPIEELIAANLERLFPGMHCTQPWTFRVTRDADFEIKEDEASDLIRAVEEELRNRRFGSAVRLEVQRGMPDDLRETLRQGLRLEHTDVYDVADPLDVSGLKQLIDLDLPEHKFPPFLPRTQPSIHTDDLFSVIAGEDVLMHHPYESFKPVVEFIRLAAKDPRVLAIKQTLYRTSGNSPVVHALAEAAAQGKQVVAIVELKARFDEENNLVWARMLEEAGVHVIYGVPGMKVHCKLCMVVRREGSGLRRYVHIGTGNYNPITARIYSDLGLLTSDPGITADVGDLFNRLTGFSQPEGYRKLLVAPRFMTSGILERIHRETEHAKAGRPAQLIFKCNSITETSLIDALYDASDAGVQIDMLVRGICCLIPGKPGLSENIRVRSVLGRFLEHSRCYWFANDGHPEAFMGSADLMDRNLSRRVEVLTPVLRNQHKTWLRDDFLQAYLDDTHRTRLMLSDGSYVRIDDSSGLDVQQHFLEG